MLIYSNHISLNNQFLENSDSPLEYNKIFSRIEEETLEKLFYLDFDSFIQRKSDASLNKLLLETYKTNVFIYDVSLEKIMEKIEKTVEVKEWCPFNLDLIFSFDSKKIKN